MIPQVAQLLRIYLNAAERGRTRPLYREIVETAHGLHIAGASVFPVELALGAHGHWHDAADEYTGADIPLVIEIVDAPERIAALLAVLGPLPEPGLTTLRTVRVLRYQHEDRGRASSGGV